MTPASIWQGTVDLCKPGRGTTVVSGTQRALSGSRFTSVGVSVGIVNIVHQEGRRETLHWKLQLGVARLNMEGLPT